MGQPCSSRGLKPHLFDVWAQNLPKLLGGPQAAKAEALGPRHNIGGLDAVLAEPWRSQVAADAARAEAAGWFWRYRTNSLKARCWQGHLFVNCVST